VSAPTIHQALAAVMADVRAVGKDGRNTQQGYNFRGIDGVLNAVGPAFRQHGVVPLPHLLAMHSEVVEVGKNRTAMRSVIVEVLYAFRGPAGDECYARVPGEAMDSGDKAVSKAMSVAYRTALIQVLALPTDDPDPDEHSYERARPAKKAAAKRQPPAQDLGTHRVDGDPIGDVPVPSAKQSLASACGGDKELEKRPWGDRPNGVDETIPAADLSALLDDAEAAVAS